MYLKMYFKPLQLRYHSNVNNNIVFIKNQVFLFILIIITSLFML